MGPLIVNFLSDVGLEPEPREAMTGGDLKAAAAGNLDRARRSYSERAWADAFQAFSHADQESPLEAEDLEQLALSAYLAGRDEEYLKALERAYNAHRDVGERLR